MTDPVKQSGLKQPGAKRTAKEKQPSAASLDLTRPKPWTSCAKWPEGLLTFSHTDHYNTTRDGHDTREAAQAVCNRLEREGLGGERCHFPVKTWVEPNT